MKTHPKPATATAGAYGKITTDADAYRPLDWVMVFVEGRAAGDSVGTVRVCDPDRKQYFERRVELTDNRGSVRFQTGGKLGNHYAFLYWPDTPEHHRRYVNFRVDAATSLHCGDAGIDHVYPDTRQHMPLGRREYDTPRGKFVGYMSADTWHFDGIWLRDWIYGLPAYQHWERDMACGLNRFLEVQREDGMVPDGIERDGKTWRVGLESDVEYILTLGVWQTWKATGDDAWMAAALPRLEKALAYIRNDPKHWDPTHRLIKRQHSCDTWDFDIDGIDDKGQSRHVIANCDQSGYYAAYRAMAHMYRHLGQQEDAQRWDDEATAYRQRTNELLWDGTKYKHHVHLDPIDHGDFDESQQLTMGNTWAMTRGLASAEQAMRIIDEYRRRYEATGDAYPWWSLQPGYPDHLKYFERRPFLRQGGYANGGLMPWVGGELCRAAFQYGREAYGVELLRQYADHLRHTGGAHVWYWPDGEPGHRTTNEVDYACWGMAEWVNALLEGLAGVRDASGQMRRVEVSPRWAVAGIDEAACVVRYAASGAYVAYAMRVDRTARRIAITFTGSGEAVRWRVLLPEGWMAARMETVGESRYAVVDAVMGAAATVVISGEQKER